MDAKHLYFPVFLHSLLLIFSRDVEAYDKIKKKRIQVDLVFYIILFEFFLNINFRFHYKTKFLILVFIRQS